MTPLREAALYPAVKHFLASRGYEAKGEVGGCDVVGVKPGEPPLVVVAELKLGFTLDLVLQGVERLACADEVWLAVPVTRPGKRRGRDRDARARKLCRLLGFGLLGVDLPRGRAEALVEPAPYRPRPNLRRRRALVTEHRKRRGDPSPGGTGGVPVMTAYRQVALACAAAMRSDGPQRPRDLKEASPRAATILARNVYGWFRRVERGVYGLTPDGDAALLRWGAVIAG